MKTRNAFGEGASPALHGNTVVINWDDETDNDFIVALEFGPFRCCTLDGPSERTRARGEIGGTAHCKRFG